MHTRQEMEQILRRAYETRKRGDVADLLELFDDGGRFCAVGGPQRPAGRDANRAALTTVIDNFELLDYEIRSMVIEGSKAAVHWRGRFRAAPTGRIAETDLLDLVEVENGRIKSFHNFFDTALAQQLLQP